MWGFMTLAAFRARSRLDINVKMRQAAVRRRSVLGGRLLDVIDNDQLYRPFLRFQRESQLLFDGAEDVGRGFRIRRKLWGTSSASATAAGRPSLNHKAWTHR